MENLINIAKKVLKTEADAVNGLIEKLDSSFEKAVTLLYKSMGRVVVTGMGKSGLVGKKIAATLSSTGTPAFFMHPGEASHGDLGMVTSDDVIIAITNSGETEEVINLLPFLKRFNVKLIVLTGHAQSTLSKAADAVLDVSVKEEACPLGFVPTSSTTAALAMGDAIAVAILIKRGFKAEDFACYHPSGTLGKKLLTTVKDLMHTGQDLPLISMSTSLAEALIEISSKRLGMTIVTDNEKKILGIITDGDIRRGVEKWGKSFFDMDIQDVMSRNPKLISRDELATKALSVMEQHSITSLLIPDDKKRALGVIHLHDILRKGIV
ncbi:MAG: KpsF/GutQ family sugar-phosphate isomerase [Nitrospiraceae bacterium]|nr:MAG: KpsF/GutQ family sugar-phosphate isomerase [Nitrospiraceae bacterium]